MAFIFGGNTPWTYEDIQRKRRVADELVAANATAPRNVGEGLAAIGRALAGRAIEKRASARDAELKADFERQFGGLFGGQSPSAAPGVPQPIASGPVAPPDPNSPAAIGDQAMAALGKQSNNYKPGDRESFISAMMPHAVEASKMTGVDPRLIVAQAAQETGWGAHAPGNNFFGIKSHGQGGGNTMATTEYVNGQPVAVNDSFRGYADMRDSALGYANFLLENPRYQPMMNAQGIDAQLAALGQSGYATDPNYASSVGNIAKSLPDLMSLASNPYASPGQKAVLEALLGQQMNASDPAYQLDLALKRAELAQAQAPDPGFTMVSPEQAKAMGLPPGAYQVGPDGKVSQIGGGGTNVTVNNGGNSNKFREESDKAASARFDEYIQGGTAAAQMVGDLKAIADLAPQIGTGKGAEVMSALGPYAEAFGIDVTGLDEAQAFKSIVDRMAPQMRPAGSGSSSDFDARQFLNSLPKLGNTPEGNQIILQTLQALQAHKMAAAQIASLAYQDPANGGITWQEAEKRIRALGDPYEAFNAYSRKNTRGTNGPAESGGDPPAPAVADDDAAYLKSLGLE